MIRDVVSAGAHCANCQTPLVGPYCSNCGQRHEPHVHSMREFASETLEGVTHADSRLWRTLWLLISRPGFLTVEFLEGRRARYLPPFRLYLVLSVVLFLVAVSVSSTHRALFLGVETGEHASVSIESTAATSETPQQRAQRLCDGSNFGIGPKSWEGRFHEGCYKVVLDN